MQNNNIICLASYRALTGLQPQPIRLVRPTPAQVIRFEKVWADHVIKPLGRYVLVPLMRF